jgi:hypothetical protein
MKAIVDSSSDLLNKTFSDALLTALGRTIWTGAEAEPVRET